MVRVPLLNRAVYRLLQGAGGVRGEEISKGYIRLLLPPDPVIVDAGAHVGGDTAAMSRLWPGGTVHAFEPVPHVFAQLRANVGGLPNVRCYPVALAAETGRGVLHVSHGGDASSSLLAPKEHLALNPHVTFPETVTVETWTLDDWAGREGCARIDFLWLDMQGAELAMLKAAPRLLATAHAVHLEVASVELYRGNPLFPEVCEWMAGQGFRLEAAEIDPLSSGNALFVRQGTPLAWGRLPGMAARKALRVLRLSPRGRP